MLAQQFTEHLLISVMQTAESIVIARQNFCLQKYIARGQ